MANICTYYLDQTLPEKHFAKSEEDDAFLECCFDCGDRAKTLRPGKKLPELLEHFRLGAASKEDPTFKEDFHVATRVANGDMEPNFPFGSVSKEVQHGFEREYARITGHLPTELGSKGPALVKLPYMSPSAQSNYYLVDMVGMEAHIIASVRKVKIYYNVCTQLEVAILEHGKQLTKDHARAVYSHAVSNEQNVRPQPLKPAANRPQSVDFFTKKFQGLAEAAEAAAGKAEEAVVPGDGSSEDGAEDKQVVPQKTMGLLFDEAESKPKKKPKASASKQSASAAAGTGASVASAPGTPAPTVPGAGKKLDAIETASASTAGKKTLQNLDKDMTFVAQRHLHNCPTSKATSLEHLIPASFLLEPSKQLSNSLSGAKRILESLKGKSETVACNLLHERILQCEHATALTSGLSTTPMAAVTAHVKGTSALWDRYSYNLQIEVCGKYAGEQLELACLCIDKPEASKCDKEMLAKIKMAQEGSVEEFMEAFFDFLDLRGDSTNADEKKAFRGDNPHFSDTLSLLQSSLDDSVYSVEASLDRTMQEFDLIDAIEDGADNKQPQPKENLEMANAFLHLFLNESFLNILNGGQEHANFLAVLACQFLKCYHKQQEFFEGLASMTELIPIKQAFEDLARFWQAVLYLLDEVCELEDGRELTGSAPDVFFLSDYSGPGFFHRSIKAIFTQAGSFWLAQVRDVVKTAGSKALLSPKLQKLKELLAGSSTEASEVSAARLVDVNTLLGEVKGGVRALEWSSLLGKVAELAVATARSMMQSPAGQTAGENYASTSVEAVSSLLVAASSVAGVPTVYEDFKAWVGSTKGARQVADLVQVMKSASRISIDYEAVRKLLPETSLQIQGTGAGEVMTAASHFVHKSLLHMTDKILGPDFKTAADVKGQMLTTLQLAKAVFANNAATTTASTPPEDGDAKGLQVFGVVHGYVLTLVQFSQSGIIYVGQRKKLQGTDSTEAAESQATKELQRGILILKNARDKCLAAVKTSLDFLNEKIHPSEDALFGAIANQSPELLQELLDLDLAKHFPLRADEVYVDAVSKLFVAYSREISESASQVKSLLKGFEEGGPSSWKKDLPTEKPDVDKVTFADLLSAAEESVEKVDGKKLRQCTEAYYEVLKTAMDVMDKFESSDDVPTMASAREVLKTELAFHLPDMRKGKILVMEMMLVRQLSKVKGKDISMDSKDPSIVDMEGLLTKQTIFLSSNLLGLTSSSIQPALWQAVQKFSK
ncbi:unnamed protein product [Symbiodinium sp. CCMP2592]|nr:unnamed protein product [Symbiodinium sp. CCMP2592]